MLKDLPTQTYQFVAAFRSSSPFVGNLPDNTYTYQSQQYTLKQHGFARDLPWQVTERISKNFAGITISLVSNPQTLAVYPFDFKLAFTYELKGNTLTLRQSYTNLSKEPMPFSTGLHPYFWVSDKPQLQFDIPSHEYLDQKNKTTHSFTGSFDFDRDEIDVAFPQLTRPVSHRHRPQPEFADRPRVRPRLLSPGVLDSQRKRLLLFGTLDGVA